jgi:Flp pilus assembly protein TadG
MARAGGTIARLRRFPGAREGVAAIEFAFIAPILIFFYLGMAETCQLIMAQRRVSHTAAALADLVTQDTDIGAQEMLEIFEAGCTIMSPFPSEDMPEKLRMRVTSVRGSDAPATDKRVNWSENNGRGLADLPDNSIVPFTVATPLATASETVVVSEASYTYKSSVGFLITTKAVSHRSEMRPRRSSVVTFTPATTALPAMSCSD